MSSAQDHPDYKDVAKALELVKDLATGVNEAVREQEHRNAIIKLQDLFSKNPEWVSPNRLFVRRGPILKQCRSGEKMYEFFLFNDLLAYASGSDRAFKLHRNIPIDAAFNCEEVEAPAGALENKKLARFAFALRLVNSTKTFIVYFKDVEERANWTASFKQIMELTKRRIGGNKETASAVEFMVKRFSLSSYGSFFFAFSL